MIYTVFPVYSEVKKEIFNNGLTIIYNRNDYQPIAVITIFIKMGSIYEPVELAGISELLQATIIKGTKNRTAQQIAEEVEFLGGTYTADSNEDYSTLSILVRSEHFNRAIEIITDIFFNPVFPEDEIEKEKANIIAGLISRRDNIFSTTIDEMMTSMYGKRHPYGRDIKQQIRSIKKLSRQDILKWWKKFYGIDVGKSNIVVVISGNVDFNLAKEEVYKNFASIRRISLPEIEYLKVTKRPSNIKKKLHFKQGYLMYGYYVEPISKDRINYYVMLKILTTYLGGGMSGKLFKVLREENSLCYETNCFYPTRVLDSHFILYAGLDHNRMNIAKLEISKIIDSIKNYGITEKEIEECKKKIKGRFLLDHQTNLRQAWYLGFWEIIGLGYKFDEDYLSLVENVTKEEFIKFINEFFSQRPYLLEFYPK
ncbi:MAG: insulinase family protein [Endomicrobia bacterium]|nr:insulinase family protein [Endomicrobiia bacterium]